VEISCNSLQADGAGLKVWISDARKGLLLPPQHSHHLPGQQTISEPRFSKHLRQWRPLLSTLETGSSAHMIVDNMDVTGT
jgi:hypothetical protein